MQKWLSSDISMAHSTSERVLGDCWKRQRSMWNRLFSPCFQEIFFFLKKIHYFPSLNHRVSVKQFKYKYYLWIHFPWTCFQWLNMSLNNQQGENIQGTFLRLCTSINIVHNTCAVAMRFSAHILQLLERKAQRLFSACLKNLEKIKGLGWDFEDWVLCFKRVDL